MLKDLFTVTRKELIEIALPDGRLGSGARNVFVLIAIAGVLFPLQTGPGWMTSWMSIYSACFPAILLVNFGADSFAGERERHTLETLLATRLTDASILLGKTLAITLYGWALILAGQLLAVITVSLAFGRGRLLFFTPAIFAGIVSMGLVLPLLLTAIAVAVSLTAPTARAAGQRMLLPFVVICGLPSALPYIARRLPLPIDASAISPGVIVLVMAGCCAVSALGALALARQRFSRERLVLA